MGITSIKSGLYLETFFELGSTSYYLICKVSCPEAVVQRCSVKNVFLEITQNSQNTCARVSFLIKLQVSGVLNDITTRILYYKEHYWDKFGFSERPQKTYFFQPFSEKKLIFNKYLIPEDDVIDKT